MNALYHEMRRTGRLRCCNLKFLRNVMIELKNHVVRGKFPPYPHEGICLNLMPMLPSETVSWRIASIVALLSETWTHPLRKNDRIFPIGESLYNPDKWAGEYRAQRLSLLDHMIAELTITIDAFIADGLEHE